MKRPTGLAALAPLATAVLALAATGAGAAQAESCGASYTVRTGDTMGAIATRCASSIEALMRANPQVRNPARISIGQELAVPPAVDSADASADADAVAAEWARQRDAAAVPLLAAGQYTVEAGDDMASIATKLGVPLRDLLAANDEIDPFSLEPGQVLALPDPEELEAPPDAAAGESDAAGQEAAAGEEAAAAPADSGAGSGATGRYTVEPGDSLAGIAAKAGVSLDALIAANKGVKPRALRPGHSLVLPAAAPDQETPDPATSDTDTGEEGAGADADSREETDAGTDGEEGETASGTGESRSGAPGSYTVEPGDSLGGIAAKTGVRLAELMAVNKGVEPRALRPGQELVLPSGVRTADPPGGGEGGTELAAVPGAEGGPAPGGDAAAPAEVAPEPERMRLEGRIRKGVECPVLKTPDGRTYSLVSQAYGFTPGDYVVIEAEPVEVSFCMQGQTVRVTSMKPRPAPQGG